MNMSVQSSAPATPTPTPTDTTAGAAAPAKATPTASGNVGLGAAPSAFDRTWDDSYVPPPEKPQPPLFQLVMKNNPELVRRVNNMLYDKKASTTELQALMDLLYSKVMELSINGEMLSVQDRQKKIEANQKERDKEFEVSKIKAAAAEKQKEWNKFWGMLKSVGSVVLSAAVIAAGVMTGNPLMAAYGAYMMVNAAMDVIDSVRAYQGKDPLGFRLSVGELAGWIAKKAFNADEKTQAIANAVTELAFGLIVGGGASFANAGKAIKAGEAISKAAAIGKRLGQFGQVAQGVSTIGQGFATIQMAEDKYQMDESKARMDRLQLVYDRLQKDLEKSQDLMKTLSEALAAIWEIAGDRLKTTREAQDRVWGGGRRNMV
jgi:hypothetical protein